MVFNKIGGKMGFEEGDGGERSHLWRMEFVWGLIKNSERVE